MAGERWRAFVEQMGDDDLPTGHLRRILRHPVDNLTTLAIRRAVLAAVEMTRRGEDVRALMVEVTPYQGGVG